MVQFQSPFFSSYIKRPLSVLFIRYPSSSLLSPSYLSLPLPASRTSPFSPPLRFLSLASPYPYASVPLAFRTPFASSPLRPRPPPLSLPAFRPSTTLRFRCPLPPPPTLPLPRYHPPQTFAHHSSVSDPCIFHWQPLAGLLPGR